MQRIRGIHKSWNKSWNQKNSKRTAFVSYEAVNRHPGTVSSCLFCLSDCWWARQRRRGLTPLLCWPSSTWGPVLRDRTQSSSQGYEMTPQQHSLWNWNHSYGANTSSRGATLPRGLTRKTVALRGRGTSQLREWTPREAVGAVGLHLILYENFIVYTTLQNSSENRRWNII